MDQLELVFLLLGQVRLQFMYFQYNMYLSIVVRTNNIHALIQSNPRTPQLAGFARQLGCKNESAVNINDLWNIMTIIIGQYTECIVYSLYKVAP